MKIAELLLIAGIYLVQRKGGVPYITSLFSMVTKKCTAKVSARVHSIYYELLV